MSRKLITESFPALRQRAHYAADGKNNTTLIGIELELGSNNLVVFDPSIKSKVAKKRIYVTSFNKLKSVKKIPYYEAFEMVIAQGGTEDLKQNVWTTMIDFVLDSLNKSRMHEDINERCWDGYKPTPGKKPYEKGSCMKEDDELQEEAEHEGKKVTLNKPFRTPDGPKKFAVYVKNDKGNVVKVTFGDPNMEIKRDDPERRANYRARHNCSSPGPKWKANYWSCKMWADKPVSKLTESVGETRFDFDVLDGPRTAKKVGAVVNIKGDSPEDALKHYLIPYGYKKFEITAKGGIIVVKGQWGANAKDVEYHYYKLIKVVSEEIQFNTKTPRA